jgi:chorismate mutase
MTASLATMRDAIDAIDARMLALLAERVTLARAVARIKRAEGLSIVDPEREAAVVDRAAAFAVQHGLNEGEVRALYWRLLALSRREQLDAAPFAEERDRAAAGNDASPAGVQ